MAGPPHSFLGSAGADLRPDKPPRGASGLSARRATPATGGPSHMSKTSKMDSKEQRSTLRAAVYRGDGPAVVHLLQNAGNYDNALQLAGDGLIAAVIQRAQGAPELARHLVLALRQRGWNGDDDLADQLDALLGSGPPPMLRPLPVDLDELAGILEGDPLNGGGRLDLTTGEVWPQAAIEYARETGEEDEDAADDPERWLWVHGEGSRDAYRDMEAVHRRHGRPWPRRPPDHRDRRARRVPPVQGRHRILARRTRAMVRIRRRAPAWPGSIVADRSRLSRAARRPP